MTWGNFVMRPLKIKIRNKLSETEIRFSLNSEYDYPIRGFPRCLVDDEKDKASKSFSRLAPTYLS